MSYHYRRSTNDFMPDSGTIAYRSSGGFGVRLDAGDGFQTLKFRLTISEIIYSCHYF